MNLNFFVSAFFLVKGELCFKNFPPSQELPSSQKKIQNNFLLQKKFLSQKKLPTHLSHTKSTQIEIIDRTFQFKFIFRSDWTIFHGKNSFSLSLILFTASCIVILNSENILCQNYYNCTWYMTASSERDNY